MEKTERENMLNAKAELETEREMKQMEDIAEESKESETDEKKESLPEESLRMTSWVDVGSGRSCAEDGSREETALKAVEVRDGLEERGLLEVGEGRSQEVVEEEQTHSVEEELAMMEEKWKEQCAINETLKQRLANEEERFRVRHLHTHALGVG